MFWWEDRGWGSGCSPPAAPSGCPALSLWPPARRLGPSEASPCPSPPEVDNQSSHPWCRDKNKKKKEEEQERAWAVKTNSPDVQPVNMYWWQEALYKHVVEKWGCSRVTANLHWMMFLFFFSIKPTPSRTLVMSYILLFCFTANLSAACQSRQFTKRVLVSAR